MNDFVEYLARQVAVSRCNFGPNERTLGVIDHIKKELKEVEAEDTPQGRAEEWIDVALLALDGATRAMREAIRARGTLDPTADRHSARGCALQLNENSKGKTNCETGQIGAPCQKTKQLNTSEENMTDPLAQLQRLYDGV